MAPFKKIISKYLNIWVLMAILLCGFALYTVPLQSKGFYFDDHFSIEKNKAIKEIDIPTIFNAFNTRFLPGLSFALNYRWCGLHPEGYRIVNLMIHCLNAFLVYLIIKSTLYLYAARQPIFFCALEWPAFFASMLFLCHPIQTEPVNFITQRFAVMGSFFYLLTLFLYIQYRCRSQKGYLAAAMISAASAMFCKEFVVTLPVMLTLYDFYFLSPLKPSTAPKKTKNQKPPETIRKRCRRLVPFFIIALIVPLLLLKTPSQAIGVANIAESHGDITRAKDSISRGEYFLTELNVVCTYIRLMVLPVNQNLDYDYPISHQLDNKTALCGVFLLSLLALAIALYKSYRLISFSILWFFIALSVESSFIPIGDVITEYRPYLASFGFVFLLVTLIYMRKTDVKILNMIAAAILIGFSIMTFQRNKVWKDEFTLWNDTLRKSPHKARPYNNHGQAFFEQGDLNQALSDCNKAITLNPNFAEAYNNRGMIYNKEGNFNQAMADYNKAIALNSSLVDAYNNRGMVYDKEGDFTQAISDYDKAIELDPQYTQAYNNRGDVDNQQGDLVAAIADFTKAITLNPNLVEAYVNRSIVYTKQDNLTLAISDCSKAIELNPKLMEAYTNRGFAYAKQGDLTQAIADFTKAIELNPKYIEAYTDLGLLYAKKGNLPQALSYYSKAIEISPQNAPAYNNRAILYYQLKQYDKAWGDVHQLEALGATINPQLLGALKQITGQDK